MYSAVSSRPEIMFTASILASEVHETCYRHTVLAKRILKYLKGTTSLFLLFSAEILVLMRA